MNLKSIIGFVKKNILEIIILLLTLTIFLVNCSYLAYPDEFVNLLAGQAINLGKIPYSQFFDHHMPFAWYLASFFLRFSFRSFILFRYYWVIFIFLVLLATGFWIRKKHHSFHPYYLIYMLFYSLASVYHWFHLYLADSLAVLFVSTIFWILIVQTLTKKTDFKMILITSGLTFLLIFSSLTYIYMALIFYIWQVYLIGFQIKKILKYLAIVILPYGIYFIYLLMTKSLSDFYFANFVYNTKLYMDIPNYVKGRFFNPLKFGLTLIYNFYNNYLPFLTKLRDFDLYQPTGMLAALGSISLLILLTIKYPLVGLIYFLLLSFSAPRSSAFLFKETDYQVTVYLIFGFISSLITLYLGKVNQYKEVVVNDLKRLVNLILVIFLIFVFIFLAMNTYSKYYLRYTQKMPGIYDLAYTADFIDDLVKDNEYFWIGPYDPNEIFYVKNGKLPGKFISLMPQFAEDESMRKSFLSQFEANPPTIIILRQEESLFMTPMLEFSQFFIDWMKGKYFRIEEIPEVQVIKSPSSINIRRDVWIRTDQKEEILSRMKEKGYLPR